MHFDLNCKLALFLVLLAGCINVGTARSYSIEEQNTVTLTLDVPLEMYNTNETVKQVLYELIANFSTKDCIRPRQNCKLIAKYYRNTGPYKRNITQEDYVFTADMVEELIPAQEGNTSDETVVNFHLKTRTGFDYLKWTELVRLLYLYRHDFNNQYSAATGKEGNILKKVPESYIAAIISNNTLVPTLIACVILGAALLLFIILVPLSNTKHCRKDLEDPLDAETGDKKESAKF